MNDAKRKPGRPQIDPELKKVAVCYKLRPKLVMWLRSQDLPATRLVEEAIIGWYGLDSQELRFRRLPLWTRQQVEQIEREADAMLAKMKARPIAE